ncbi:CSEP0239 putative effector protein [Blumeria hordei DH14]|uniref:CSEP0239 putative effector protein n=1 Tax=Blumeria graminis f. sp. hordei (strain DH14) TaxID=546991 RepID=N1JDF1_BLUG1|nr:CSEP0239 putative effector protein [Blumeria hordei DH14]
MKLSSYLATFAISALASAHYLQLSKQSSIDDEGVKANDYPWFGNNKLVTCPTSRRMTFIDVEDINITPLVPVLNQWVEVEATVYMQTPLSGFHMRVLDSKTRRDLIEPIDVMKSLRKIGVDTPLYYDSHTFRFKFKPVVPGYSVSFRTYGSNQVCCV